MLHEVGHWVAMKLFGNRYMKMFFIQLIGAVVTGRKYNVAAWKQVVVFLARPVPGIFLGGMLYWVSLSRPSDPKTRSVASVTLLIRLPGQQGALDCSAH